MDTLNFYIKSKKGFTLIEIIIVAIIASILIMMALVSFRGFHRATEFENTVDNLISFIHYAQTYAVTEWKRKAMVVLPDENRLVFKLRKDNIKEFKLPDDYSIDSDVVKIIFDSTGGFDLIDAENPDIDIKTVGWIKIRKESTGDKAKIELWGFGGNVKCKSISLGR